MGHIMQAHNGIKAITCHQLIQELISGHLEQKNANHSLSVTQCDREPAICTSTTETLTREVSVHHHKDLLHFSGVDTNDTKYCTEIKCHFYLCNRVISGLKSIPLSSYGDYYF